MKKFVKTIKLLPYVFEFKTNVFCGVLFWVLGVMITVGASIDLEDGFSNMLGPLYVMLGPMMAIQMCYSLLMSRMLGASPKKKWIEIIVPNVLTGLNNVIGYLLIVVVFAGQMQTQPEGVDAYCKLLFYIALMTCILNIYFAGCCKQLLVSSVLFFFAYVGIAVLMNIDPLTELIEGHFAGSFLRAVIECGILLIAGWLGSCVFRKALYKVETSSYAGGFKLRKMMQ